MMFLLNPVPHLDTVFAVQKTGHPLSQLTPALPDDVLRDLRNNFSVTTAEELLSTAANRDEHLPKALHLNLEQWIILMSQVCQAIEPSIREFLAEPLASPFGKGAILNDAEKLSGDYQQYLVGPG